MPSATAGQDYNGNCTTRPTSAVDQNGVEVPLHNVSLNGSEWQFTIKAGAMTTGRKITVTDGSGNLILVIQVN